MNRKPVKLLKEGDNMIRLFGHKYKFCSSVLESLKTANFFTRWTLKKWVAYSRREEDTIIIQLSYTLIYELR